MASNESLLRGSALADCKVCSVGLHAMLESRHRNKRAVPIKSIALSRTSDQRAPITTTVARQCSHRATRKLKSASPAMENQATLVARCHAPQISAPRTALLGSGFKHGDMMPQKDMAWPLPHDHGHPNRAHLALSTFTAYSVATS
jgi:hypothetical protein